ncbi:hypothetical protein GCM10027596_40900 [Nocardioides korecus]
MNGVGKKRDRASQNDKERLGHSRDAERDEADLDRSDAVDASFEGTVDGVSGVVAVRLEDAREDTSETTCVVVVMAMCTVAVLVAAPVLVALPVLVVFGAGRLGHRGCFLEAVSVEG